MCFTAISQILAFPIAAEHQAVYHRPYLYSIFVSRLSLYNGFIRGV